MELTNVCLCCAIRDSFLSDVEVILEHIPDGLGYIIVEITCVEDPVPLLTFLIETAIAHMVALDVVRTLVGAIIFDLQTHMASNAAFLQFMVANAILLSMADVAGRSKVKKSSHLSEDITPPHASQPPRLAAYLLNSTLTWAFLFLRLPQHTLHRKQQHHPP